MRVKVGKLFIIAFMLVAGMSGTNIYAENDTAPTELLTFGSGSIPDIGSWISLDMGSFIFAPGPDGGKTYAYGIVPCDFKYDSGLGWQPNNGGGIFRLDPSSTSSNYAFTHLVSFSDSSDIGYYPTGKLCYSAGYLFGVTTLGGANGDGTVFQLGPLSSPTLKCSSICSNSDKPVGNLITGSDGKTLYGMNDSSIFKIVPDVTDPSKTTVSIIYNFPTLPSGDIDSPEGNLCIDSQGTYLYGLTFQGGQAVKGSYTGRVFRLRLADNSVSFKNLYIPAAATGYKPAVMPENLIINDKYLYCILQEVLAQGKYPAPFQLVKIDLSTWDNDPTGNVSLKTGIATFDCSCHIYLTKAEPENAKTGETTTSIYGVLASNNKNIINYIFKIDSDDSFTTLYSSPADRDFAGPVTGKDGLLYGIYSADLSNSYLGGVFQFRSPDSTE